jgi:ABC-type lipoprotein export system ATPase subunit
MTLTAAEREADVLCAGVMHLYPGDDAPVVALRNVDLEVANGELIAILGPSGSGKSTLLSLLSGLLRATAGTVMVAGHDLGHLDNSGLNKLRATDVALLMQEPLDNLLPYATGVQNVRFAQRGARRRGRQLRWAPLDILKALGLGELADRPVLELSGGQQQQIALATVLSASPRVLLVDEPTAHLDPSGRDAIITTLRQANEVTRTTTVVVTHDPVVAHALPRTVTIRYGQVGAEGRGGREFVVVTRDGTIQLPPLLFNEHPPGTLFSVQKIANGIQLHVERDA